MMKHCHCENIKTGDSWWWCDTCKRGEREVESDDIIIILPLSSPPPLLQETLREKREKKEVDDRHLKLIINIMWQHRSMSLGMLRKRVRGLPGLKRALNYCVKTGLLEVEKRESGAIMYTRIGNLKAPEFISPPMRSKMEKILSLVSSPSHPVSRSEIYRYARLDTEVLDEVLHQLMKMNVIRANKAYRLYYQMKEDLCH